MVIFGTIGIAILFALVLIWKFKEYIVWWEIVLLIAIPTAMAFGSKALIETYTATSTEYWGDEVVSVYEEEPYNYWHEETCYEEYACGTDSDGNTEYCTRSYDCSYQDDVGPEWYAVTKLGRTYSISEYKYDKWSKQFGGNRIKTKTRENYDSSDRCAWSNDTKFQGQRVGTYSYVWRTDWNGDYNTSVPLTTEETYENRIKASDYTVFNYIEITEDSAKAVGLYDYPDLDRNYFDYPSVLGYNDNTVQKMFHRINGHLGKSKQVRVWVLIHDTTDSEIGWIQENYWVGGNKNEFVINIGVDGDKISWCHVFSWSDIQSLKDDVEKFVVKEKILNRTTFSNIADYTHKEVESRFERLEFTQFDYIVVDPPTWTIVLAYIFTLIVCVVISVLVVRNEYNNLDRYGRRKY